MFAVVATVCLGAPVVAADRVALVIGNGTYVNADALRNPPNDARAMAKALSDIGFDVAFGQDLERTPMERLVRDFLRRAASANVAVLFYAGHALQIDGRNYLLPIDAKLETASDLNYETIKLDDILEGLNDPARANIILLDACRDNPLARSFVARLGASRSGAVSTGLAAYSTLGTGTLVAFSTAPGQVALDGDGTNSPFTMGLIKHLSTPGLEVRQMLTRVRNDVARATRDRQVPWDNSSLRGDVYLAGAPSVAQSIAAAVPPPAGPSPDEVAWDFVKDTRDSGQLRRFIEQFAKSTHHQEAAEKLAALEQPPMNANVSAVAGDIARKLQLELHRVGCFTAEPDGDWNASSRRALELFNKYSGTSLDTKVASLDAVDAVRGKTARICPLVCARGYHVEGEQCVATVCRTGYAVDEDGDCQRVQERVQNRRYRDERREQRREPSEAQKRPLSGVTIGCAPALQPCQ
jgi:Caspase domain